MIDWWNSLGELTRFAIANAGLMIYLMLRLDSHRMEIDYLRRRVQDLETKR